MTVYANEKGTAFKLVNNDDTFTQIEATELTKRGYIFYTENGFYDDGMEDDLIDQLMTHLSLKQLLDLEQRLLNHWNFNAQKRNFYDDWLEYIDQVSLENASQRDFLNDFVKDDDFGITDGIKQNLEEANGWHDMNIIFNFCKENCPDIRTWYVEGYCQGECTFVWQFDSNVLMNYFPKDDGQNTYYGLNFQDYLTNVIYGSFVVIYDCDSHGELLEDYAPRWVCGYRVPDNSEGVGEQGHDEYVDEYMQKMYRMHPANVNYKYVA